jgi:SAM-dependent methyltransferase
VALDWAEAPLRRLDPACRGPWPVRADGEALPFADGAFDRVANIGSLEHFPDPAAGAREMARVLAPGGLALILLPNAYAPRGPVLHAWRTGELHDDGQPIQRYGSRLQWAGLLADAGLDVLRVHGCESLVALRRGPALVADLGRHPSRLIALLGPWLPPDLAAELVFLCRRRRT